MRESTAFLLLLTLVAVVAKATDLCTIPGVGVGVCIETTECASLGGKSTAGYCPGGSNIRCCTGLICGTTGLCMQTSECDGTAVSGLCPGPSTFKCCKNLPCDGGRGKCMPSSSCTETVIPGMCPGPTGYTCCEGSSPTPGGQGDKIVAAARSMVGKWPYSWGGGNNYGPTKGIVQTSSPYCDDRNVTGFDCSGLAKYSTYQGTGISLYHKAQRQHDDCTNLVNIADRQPGDLVFFGSSASSITHVAIYSGGGNMIEAPGHDSQCVGIPVREKTLRTSGLIDRACRYWS